MNSYYTQQVRESNFKPIGTSEAYLNFKAINHATKWNAIFQPYDLNKHIEKKYLGSLPYDYGHYNDLEHYNTYSNKNYIPPSYRVNELFPNVGVLSSVLKNR
jgi:hypothetical protein